MRHIPPAIATALEQLFRDRDRVVLDGNPSTTWRFSIAAPVAPPAMLLRGSQTELALSISDESLCERIGEREWWDYEGQARPLAWTLAHHRLIEGIGQLLGEPLMPSGFAAGTTLPPADPLTTLVLGFSVASSDGRTAAGALRLSTTMVARLAAHPGWQRPDPLGTAWSQLPARLRIELQGLPFDLAELKAAEIGDVLVLGRRAQCLKAMTVVATSPRADAPLRLWSAVASAEGVTISSGASSPPPKSQLGSLERLPLDFELATLSVSLAELASFKPGYQIKVPGSALGARAGIRVRDTRIGYGELVSVGGTLGIQLLGYDLARLEAVRTGEGQ